MSNRKDLALLAARQEGTLLPAEWDMADKVIRSAKQNEIILPSPPDDWLAVLGETEEKND